MAFVTYLSANHNPKLGLGIALTVLMMLLVHAFVQLPIWPTRKKAENLLVFGVYWGLLFGTVVPRLVLTIVEDGPMGVLNILLSPVDQLAIAAWGLSQPVGLPVSP